MIPGIAVLDRMLSRWSFLHAREKKIGISGREKKEKIYTLKK